MNCVGLMALLSFLDGLVGGLDEWYFSYHCYANRLKPPMFYQGWGSREAIGAVNRGWLSMEEPLRIDMRWDENWTEQAPNLWIRPGRFATPAYREHLPPESWQAFVHFIRPAPQAPGPVVVILPTSREAGIQGRMPAARALARRGISSVLLESPYMGRRKPVAQHGTTLAHFSDFFVLSAVVIEEARAVLAWLADQAFTDLGVAGISKGGYLATVAGLRASVPTRIVALLAPHSGVAVLLDGLLGRLCDWDTLQQTSGSSVPVRSQMAEVFAATSLERLPFPQESQRLTLIGARRDRYVPPHSYEMLQRHWGARAEVKWLPGGHVSSIAERGHFIDAVAAMFAPA